MSNLLKYNKKLVDEWDYERNKDVDINTVTSGSSKKVWWKCKKNHEWQAVIHTRVNGVGCPYCNRKKAIKGVNDFATLYPSLLTEWDYIKNDELRIKPDEMLIGSQKKVYWICNNNHSYMESIYNRVKRNNNCPYCSCHRLLKGFNDFASCHKELLTEWDYTKNKNNNLNPDEVIGDGSNIKAWWKCDNGHEWYATIRSRVTGHGCPICSNNKVLIGFNDLKTTNPEILEIWNYDKNKSDAPSNYSHGSTRKVWWKCDKGHEWKASISSITRGNRCPYCANQRLLKGFNDLASRYPELLDYWDYDKNEIKPNEIFSKSPQLIWWKCDKGHSYKQSLNIKTRGNIFSCPICSKYQRISIPEKIIYFYVSKVFDDVIENFKSDWLDKKEIDMFIPKLNIGIEYDGFRYHKTIEEDRKKDLLCDKHNTKLIRIREKDCPNYKSNSIKIFTEKNYSQEFTYLESALSRLAEILEVKFDVNIERDISKVLRIVNIGNKDNCLAITNPEVLDEWDYEKNEEMKLTPYNITNGTNIKAWWKCENGHSYKSAIGIKISQNTGCPYCNGRKILKGFNDLASNCPELIKEWDYDKNEIKPDEVSKWSLKKVWWICSKKHSYQSAINSRLAGCGCPYCSGHRVLDGFNDIATTNPELKNEWDYEKNSKLGYYMNNYTKGNATKVWWKCDKGHSYQASINSKTSPKKTGCPYCSGMKVMKGYNDFATLFPNLLKEWDYDKNNEIGIKPDELSKGSHNKVWWKCDKGHSYQASIPSRVRGTNCPYCAGNKVLVGFNDLATTHPEMLKKWDYERNEKMGITPNNVSKSYSKKVWWRCENGHSYLREIYNQRNGYGKCPICKKMN